MRLGVDAAGDEALELVAILVEDPERRIGGTRQLPGRLEHEVENHLEIELRNQRAPDVDQALEPLLVQPRTRGFPQLAHQLDSTTETTSSGGIERYA